MKDCILHKNSILDYKGEDYNWPKKKKKKIKKKKNIKKKKKKKKE